MKKLTLTQKKQMQGYVYILPWVIGFLFFFLSPLITTIRFSFSDVKLTGLEMTFVGLKNYHFALLEDADFPRLIVESIQYMLINVPVLMIFSFFVAVLLKGKFRGSGSFKAVFFFTVVLNMGLFYRLNDETYGYNSMQLATTMSETVSSMGWLQSLRVDEYLLSAGFPSSVINYMVNQINNIFHVIAQAGIQIFIFLVGLNSIPEHLYESARLEGAAGWEVFWKISFPLVSPLILVNVIFSVIDFFTSYKNSTLRYILQLSTGSLQYGQSSAMAWIYFAVIMAILGILSLIISRRVVYQE